MTNITEQMRQRIAELEEGLRWIASHDNFGLTDGSPVTRQCIDALVARAAALLSAPPPASEPDADVVERVAKFSQIADAMRVEATRYDHRPGNKAFNDDHVSAAQNLRGYASQINAALSAMRPDPDADADVVERVKDAFIVIHEGDGRHAVICHSHKEAAEAIIKGMWCGTIHEALQQDDFLRGIYEETIDPQSDSWADFDGQRVGWAFEDGRVDVIRIPVALTAMRPAIDWEKIAEIRRAYDAWRAADTLCGLLADPEDEGSPSELQEAAAEAAWAWDQAASKFMWNADALLAMIGGGDE